ncbi:hypothetical protein MAL01_00555 [Leptospira noguchii]|uniref:hypothetical protein n=1 Tax=Leptospira noguchii TaxID=28182 RepID=UPI001FB5FB62|nr:hypothetical protein [Leptospira noguchii]UOG34332.1 hypothetical protein MAL02_00555 [Leptospira noguchii]UOG45198.1 hypothetical protein MAL01_00555 [Leptospira noguchii]
MPQHIVCFGRVFRFLGKLKTLSLESFESMFILLKLFLPKKGLAPSQSRVVLDWVPGRLSRVLIHPWIRIAFFRFLRKLKTLSLERFESMFILLKLFLPKKGLVVSQIAVVAI